MYNIYKPVKLIEQHQYLGGEIKPKIKRWLRRAMKTCPERLGNAKTGLSVCYSYATGRTILIESDGLRIRGEHKNVHSTEGDLVK